MSAPHSPPDDCNHAHDHPRIHSQTPDRDRAPYRDRECTPSHDRPLTTSENAGDAPYAVFPDDPAELYKNVDRYKFHPDDYVEPSERPVQVLDVLDIPTLHRSVYICDICEYQLRVEYLVKPSSFMGTCPECGVYAVFSGTPYIPLAEWDRTPILRLSEIADRVTTTYICGECGGRVQFESPIDIPELEAGCPHCRSRGVSFTAIIVPELLD